MKLQDKVLEGLARKASFEIFEQAIVTGKLDVETVRDAIRKAVAEACEHGYHR